VSGSVLSSGKKPFAVSTGAQLSQEKRRAEYTP